MERFLCKGDAVGSAAEHLKEPNLTGKHCRVQQQQEQHGAKPGSPAALADPSQSAKPSSDMGWKGHCSSSPAGNSGTADYSAALEAGGNDAAKLAAPGGQESEGSGYKTALTAREMQGLRGLVAAGIAHREVVLQLLEAKVESADCFEWKRALRHYWDPEGCNLKVCQKGCEDANVPTKSC
jgi:hypothetical protein